MLICVGCGLRPIKIPRAKGKEEISLLEAAGDGKCEEALKSSKEKQGI